MHNRDAILDFGTPLISQEVLQRGSCNLVCELMCIGDLTQMKIFFVM